MEELGGIGDRSMALIWVSHGFAWVVGLGLQIAFVAIALGPVRRLRRDAAPWLVAAAVMGLVGAILGPVLGGLGSFLGNQLGIEMMLTVQGLTGILGTVVHAVIFLFLLRGILVLARPAP